MATFNVVRNPSPTLFRVPQTGGSIPQGTNVPFPANIMYFGGSVPGQGDLWYINGAQGNAESGGAPNIVACNLDPGAVTSVSIYGNETGPHGLNGKVFLGAQFDGGGVFSVYAEPIIAFDVGLSNFTQFYLEETRVSSIENLPASTTAFTFISGSVNHVGPIPVSVTTFRVRSAGLTAALVNQILINLDANGGETGTCELQDNAAPTGDGITAKNGLIAKGWTVNTD